ncbi:MAG: hypothetical protein LBE89_02485 [Helicobacteraceae bacterium]|jgi:hypothetical protein|nr:hypothetical protein [Helicobacteraceae bacterium]
MAHRAVNVKRLYGALDCALQKFSVKISGYNSVEILTEAALMAKREINVRSLSKTKGIR